MRSVNIMSKELLKQVEELKNKIDEANIELEKLQQIKCEKPTSLEVGWIAH